MTFPTEDHPRFCPQSGGPGNRSGCPRCGRNVGTKEGMAGLPGPHRRPTLLPHLRFRTLTSLDSADLLRRVAVMSACYHLAEPTGHRGGGKHGRWHVVRLLGYRDGVEPEIDAADLDAEEAFARMDELNGWPVVDGLDIARHLAIWHDHWLASPPGLERGIEIHTEYHQPRGTPHIHTEEHGIAVLVREGAR